MTSLEEKVQVVIWLIQNSSEEEVSAKFTEKYGRKAPNKISIQRWYQNFLQKGSIVPR